MDEVPGDRIIFNWFNFLACLNLNLLLDPSIRHFGTLPRFVRHYGIRHSGTNPLWDKQFHVSPNFSLVAFVHVQTVPALAHRHEKVPLLTLGWLITEHSNFVVYNNNWSILTPYNDMKNPCMTKAKTNIWHKMLFIKLSRHFINGLLKCHNMHTARVWHSITVQQRRQNHRTT